MMLLVATALSSGVTLSQCASSHGVTFVPPDASDNDGAADANGPDAVGFFPPIDASDAPSE